MQYKQLTGLAIVFMCVTLVVWICQNLVLNTRKQHTYIFTFTFMLKVQIFFGIIDLFAIDLFIASLSRWYKSK